MLACNQIYAIKKASSYHKIKEAFLIANMVPRVGFEPTTHALKGRYSAN